MRLVLDILHKRCKTDKLLKSCKGLGCFYLKTLSLSKGGIQIPLYEIVGVSVVVNVFLVLIGTGYLKDLVSVLLSVIVKSGLPEISGFKEDLVSALVHKVLVVSRLSVVVYSVSNVANDMVLYLSAGNVAASVVAVIVPERGTLLVTL